MQFVPIWLRVTQLDLRNGLLTRRRVVGAAVVEGLLHGGTVARQVYFIGVGED